MKTIKLLALSLFAFATATTVAQSKKVDLKASTVSWVGKKVTGSHSGDVSLKEGTLIFKGSKVVGGNFTVDMTSITVTDLKPGQGKENLEGHLKNEDFFGVEKFPTAKLVFKSIGEKSAGVYSVTADLTIKGVTNSINFELKVANGSATANFNVDRTKYDIKYGSGSFFSNLGDKTINDEFELSAKLKY